MYFPFFVARRYLFSKKSHNAINIISGISITGVMVGTIALIVILSIFNGLDLLVKSLMNSFDPDLKITAVEGKTYIPDSTMMYRIKSIKGVESVAEIVEETALLEYNDKQNVITAKGVSANYAEISGIDSMITQGAFALKRNQENMAVVGEGIAYYMALNLQSLQPLKIYFPDKNYKISDNPESAFNSRMIYPAGFFSIQNEFDTKYVLLPIDFVRDLLMLTREVSAIEIKLSDKLSEKEQLKIQEEVQKCAGSSLKTANRQEQHVIINKTMRSEKWAIYLILTFILIIAAFNVVGSLTMLIIDKKNDITTLKSLGADKKHIHYIFFIEGWLISLIGAVAGLGIGMLICYLQKKFHLISFPNSSIISYYPVEMRWPDFILIFLTVGFIGFIASWFPVRYITNKFIHV